jgi:regulator of sigma E protease
VSDLLLKILSLVLVLGVLVFVHELGHFLAAKWAGIRVFRFSLGMGAPIKRLTWVRGHTEYAVSWLPLGGYVKMASGEEMAGDALEGKAPELSDVPPDETFESKPVWKRMIVILAGVVMNVLFAWVVYSSLFIKNGREVNPVTTVGRVLDTFLLGEAKALAALEPGDSITAIDGVPVTSWEDVVQLIQQGRADSMVVEVAGRAPIVMQLHRDDLNERLNASGAILPSLPPIVGRMLPGRPAEKAGLRMGDTVLAVEGQPIRQWYDMTGLVEDRVDQPTRFLIGRPDGRVEITIAPYAHLEPLPNGRERSVGRIGVFPQPYETRSEPLSLGQALAEGWGATVGSLTFIGRTVRGMFTGRVSTREVGGPIAIAQAAGESVRMGLDRFLSFMALISVNLAVVNLLPIPVLDGGQFVFLLGEAVLRKPLPLRLRQRLTAVGLVLILMLTVLAFSNDIRRLFGI